MTRNRFGVSRSMRLFRQGLALRYAPADPSTFERPATAGAGA